MDLRLPLAIFVACFSLVRSSTVGCVMQYLTAETFVHGSFKSPGHPSNYPPNAACDYVITAGKDQYIEITFLEFQLRNKTGTERTDYLQIRDAKATRYLEGTLSAPMGYRSKKNVLRLRFVSDGKDSATGFSALFVAVPNARRCRKRSHSEPQGKFSIQGSINCYHIIKAPSGHNIKLELTKIQRESDRHFMHVLDGREDNRQQDIYYRRRSFMTSHFISKTNRVIIEAYGHTFTAKAAYKVEKIIDCGFSPFHILNGEVDCELNTETGKAETCKVSCNDFYVLKGSSALTCSKMTQENMPSCEVDKKYLDICEANVTDPECPHSPGWLGEYYASQIDASFGEDGSLGIDLNMTFPDLSGGKIGRSAGNIISCNGNICSRNPHTTYHHFNCPVYGNWLAQQHRRYDAPFRSACTGYCYSCRKVSCGKPVNVYFS